MMKIYRTQDKQLTRVDDMNEGAWICLTNPTDDEVRRVAATLDIEPADIVAATDPEESARISLEDGYTVIIVDIPVKVDGAGEGIYTTIPLGILLTQELIVTVCSTDTAVIGDFAACRVKGFSTRKKMRFVYQLLYRAATMYQQELRLIDRRRQAIEKKSGRRAEGQRPDGAARPGIDAGLLCHESARQRYGAGPPDPL